MIFPNRERKKKPIHVPIVEKIHRLESAQCPFLDHSETLVFSICESDDSYFWNALFFSIAFFQLENTFFVNTGFALDEVRWFRSEVFSSKYGNKPHLFSRHDATT